MIKNLIVFTLSLLIFLSSTGQQIKFISKTLLMKIYIGNALKHR
jgi:hypothetical protein